MRNELELEAIIEDYLLGNLTDEESKSFELLRQNDPTIDNQVVTHKFFLESIGAYSSRLQLKNKLDNIHSTLDVASLADQFRPHPSKIVTIWRKNKAFIGIAASFVVLSLISIYSIQHNSKQADSYLQMRKDVVRAIKSQNNLIRNIKTNAETKLPKTLRPGNFGGTGFAISTNGYIFTNLHVVRDADSIYIQNSNGESFKVKVVHTDPLYDMAILKVDDRKFKNLPPVPYTIKKNSAGVGENVYTLGYPKDDAVLGEGYVSSKNGFVGDTTQYQVSIPVNPGNSGGPLLDNSGNLVGIISGKESQADGAAFAIKSTYIIDAINAIPTDSLGKKPSATRKSALFGLKRTKQIEKLQEYVFMIKVYN
ncbi:MAG: trypsin-like peptidase domain-containing protein [Pedobacter sp.]|nr:trypsin-like peptidase domain-containing protein [Pedobacter sp.]